METAWDGPRAVTDARHWSWSAGIQRHLALGAAGWVGGLYISKWIESNSAERDAVLKHYIQLHPEDFPVPGDENSSHMLARRSSRRQSWSEHLQCGSASATGGQLAGTSDHCDFKENQKNVE